MGGRPPPEEELELPEELPELLLGEPLDPLPLLLLRIPELLPDPLPEPVLDRPLLEFVPKPLLPPTPLPPGCVPAPEPLLDPDPEPPLFDTTPEPAPPTAAPEELPLSPKGDWFGGAWLHESNPTATPEATPAIVLPILG